MAKAVYITQSKLGDLQQELDYLKNVREKEIARQIQDARSFGDLSENSEYDEAKNEQGKLYSRIAEVENILANYKIIDPSDQPPGEVTIGSTVTLEDSTDSEVLTYTIVGSTEADPLAGRISDESPLGRALLGHKIGETVNYQAPVGIIKYKVQAITA